MGALFVFFTGGIVFFTLIVNGSATQFILHLLHMDQLSEAKIGILNRMRNEMQKRALEIFGALSDEVAASHWPAVKQHISCLNNLDEECNNGYLHTVNLTDIRVRFLNGESEMARRVINESLGEGEEAEKFLEDVCASFPLVLRFVKIRQVTNSVLKHLGGYVQNLRKKGLLEEQEMICLDEALQRDQKKLHKTLFLPTRERREKQESSSDDVIIGIDSPSALTFQHASSSRLFLGNYGSRINNRVSNSVCSFYFYKGRKSN